MCNKGIFSNTKVVTVIELEIVLSFQAVPPAAEPANMWPGGLRPHAAKPWHGYAMRGGGGKLSFLYLLEEIPVLVVRGMGFALQLPWRLIYSSTNYGPIAWDLPQISNVSPVLE